MSIAVSPSVGQGILLGLLALAILILAADALARRSPFISVPVLLAVLGLVAGRFTSLPRHLVTSELILLMFVPGLVFEAAVNVNLPALRRVLAPVGLLATLGVVATVLGIAAAVHYGVGLAWPAAMVLGGILSSTDPIAVVWTIRRMQVPVRLSALLEGESLLNDGTGVAVFTAILGAITTGELGAGHVAGLFLLEVAGGTAIGVAWGLLCAWGLRVPRSGPSRVLLTLVTAYGSYLVADLLHVSGVIAVVVAGLVVAGQARASLRDTEVLDFWETLGFAFNAVLFFLVGAGLPWASLKGELFAAGVAFLAMLMVRLPVTTGILAATRVPRRWWALVWWGGLRGGLGVALALSAGSAAGVGAAPELAYAAIFLSLLVQGSLTPLFARRVTGFSRGRPRPPEPDSAR